MSRGPVVCETTTDKSKSVPAPICSNSYLPTKTDVEVSLCLLQRLVWNKLAEHKWRFACVAMMTQHCWLSSIVTFQGILTSIAKKPYISYDFFSGGGGGGVWSPCPPSGSAHE